MHFYMQDTQLGDSVNAWKVNKRCVQAQQLHNHIETISWPMQDETCWGNQVISWGGGAKGVGWRDWEEGVGKAQNV